MKLFTVLLGALLLAGNQLTAAQEAINNNDNNNATEALTNLLQVIEEAQVDIGLLRRPKPKPAKPTKAPKPSGPAKPEPAHPFKECAQAPASPEDRRPNKSQLRYATYNAEFLFMEGYGALQCPGKDCKWETRAMAMKHITKTASNILKLNPDILQLTEVEDCAALDLLIEELKKQGDDSYKPYLIRGQDRYTGQNVALITRVDPSVDLKRNEESVVFPVADTTCPSGTVPDKGGQKSVTKQLYTYFNVEGFSKPITVIGAHFLARPDDKKRCGGREAQAVVIANIAKAALAKGHHAIISGDLNDWDATVLDKNNNKPISNVLGIMRGDSFTHAGSKVPQTERFSQWWDKNHNCVYESKEVSTLDHILVSNSLWNQVSEVKYATDLYTPSCEGFDSDHFPISIVIDSESGAKNLVPLF